MKKSKGIDMTAAMPAIKTQMTKQQMENEMRYRAESDLRTLQQANEIMHDKSRLKMAKHHAHEQMKAVERVTKKR